MGRTPWYNKGDGKDHWSIGSVMFAGHGITGNRVIGETDEKQFLVPVDAKSLAIDAESGSGAILAAARSSGWLYASAHGEGSGTYKTGRDDASFDVGAMQWESVSWPRRLSVKK